jgi:dTDP-L-rhamnose 4-epimerase
VYALSKFDQEQLCLVFGQSYGVPTIALRFFNVYGPHQALSNPYTGVLAIFAARLLNGRPPLIFEDGGQKRDFVSVLDVARAVALALDSGASGCAVNVGSGRSTTISEVAAGLIALLGASDVGSLVGGKYRAGDIRHCFADISLARQLLGYEPRVELEDGMADLAAWLEGQVAEDGVERAAAELARRGLTV